ncbi:TPA: ATP-binding cassette domain-containing protein, partial [Streptococcus equi subsp. zooepidemicus]|nr:ATP-binding cassette domain-containing protein [Streptococcus equi subsp. zooepidemicus]
IPVLTQLLIDSVQTNNYDFRYIILSIVFLGIVSGTVFYFKSVLSITLMKNFSWHLLSTAFNRILSLPSKYFTVRSPGEIVYRLNSLTRIQDLFGTSLIQLFLDIISLFAILIYLSGVSIILTGVELLFILLLFTLLINLQPKIQSTSDNELHQASLAQSIQLDAIVSINNIKLGGYKEAYKEDWASKYKKSLDYTAERMNIQQSWIGTILGMVSAFVPLVILSMALFQFSLGRLSLGEAIATQTVTSLLYNYANSIFTTFSNFSVLNRYVDLAEDIYEYPIENSGDIKYQIFKDELVLDNVSFSYSGNNIYALRSINLKIKKGETIALVGESGSGKSTLGKIISSLFMPTIGTIYLDGISYKDYELDSFRNRIGYIPQESYLHNRSIIDNIALGCETERDEIIKKCKNIPFLDFINNLPMGYNTQISEMGGNLSGGQRQRIQIAKILIKQPELLIMDEATSSLDNVSQKYVYDELNVMNCTKIIIAHRLETILNADKIIVLESGKISQVGTHDQLITEAGGLYSKLFTAENLENKK